MIIQGATPRAQSPDMQAPVLDIKWSADGSSIYAVGCNKKAVIWNLATSAVTELGAHDAPIKSCHWCPSLNALATGSWDSTLRYWDVRAPREMAKVALPGKLNTMDVRDASMVLGTSDKKFHVFNLSTPDRPLRSLESPLKLQTRCMRICADGKFYLAASSEGRCAIRALDATLDATTIPGVHPAKTYAFAFKCHRDESLIFPVNAVDAHPRPENHNVFMTAGGDGVVSFWDREKRHRVREMKVSSSYGQGAQVPVTDARWSSDGKCFAYAMGYDWSKGGEHYDPAKMAPQLWVHGVTDKDLKKA
jgi:mRNA export factor